MGQENISTEVDVQLFFRGTDLNPEDITQMLIIRPSSHHKRGDRHGINKEMIWKTGFRLVDSKDWVQSKDIEEHLIWILNHLEPVNKHLALYTSNSEVDVEINLLFSLFRYNSSSSLRPQTISRLALLNIPIGISISYLGSTIEEGD
jgi:hypothetical protein